MSQALRVVAEPCRGIDVCDRKRALVAINHKSPAVVLETFGTLGGGLGEGRREPLAETIAHALQDPASIAGFKRLSETHPEPLLLEALRRTLRIPPERITRSRGACFTGIVRKLAEAGWTAPVETHS